MRSQGTLSKWNSERGFGFIAQANGKADIFVHISSFPRDGVVPQIGELLSFECQTAPDGRAKAVRVMRAGTTPPRTRAAQQQSTRPRAMSAIAGVLILGGVGFALVQRLHSPGAVPVAPAAQPAASLAAPLASDQFKCDGRTRCSQMTSCEEATFFIRNCPGTEMDGDGDGEPCEAQLCE